jgi:membrane protease subunit HflK
MIEILTPAPLADPSPLRKATFQMAAIFFGAWLVGLIMDRFTPNILFVAESSLFLWTSVAALIHHLFSRLEAWDTQEVDSTATRSILGKPSILNKALAPSFARRWQWIIVTIGASMIISLITGLHSWKPVSTQDRILLQFEIVAFLGIGIFIHFLVHYISNLQARLKLHRLDTLLILTRLAFWASMAGAAIIFISLSLGHNLDVWLGWSLFSFVVLLAVEPLLRWGFSLYQPRNLRSIPGPATDSLLLDLLFGNGHNLKGSIYYLEEVIGQRLKDVWIFKFFRQTGLMILCGVLVLGWLSTALTMVPPASHGVLIHLGRFESRPLAPGLHLTLPWPFDYVVLVDTEQIHQISLGFDNDLKGPVLWNEPHVEGEKNLLTGDGEALLTINVPILYKINDAVAYLASISDPKSALQDLAERCLLHVIGSRDSFGIMISDRAKLASQLQSKLQKELDSLKLGLHVIFVGLQDVHPPIEVSPAFQEVVSAEEEQEAMIDQAQTHRASTLPEAQSQAFILKSQADSDADSKISKATGSANRFIRLAKVDHMYSDLFRTQLRFYALENSLSAPNKIVVSAPIQRIQQFYLDLRNTSEIPPP